MSIVVGQREFVSVDELRSLVVKAATQYEQEGFAEDFEGVEVTDGEYDELVRTFAELSPDDEALQGTSPSTAAPKGKIVKHDPPMTSIAKADGTLEEKIELLRRWIQYICDRLGVAELANLPIVRVWKYDGVALRINYVDGVLVSAGLRPRDGVNGSDVTRHMKHVRGVPQRLALPLTLSLNGEIVCKDEDFAKVNAANVEAGNPPYKNPRNYAAGCMGRDDAEENKGCGLSIAFYSITGFDDSEKYYRSEMERAQWANDVDGLNLRYGGLNLFVNFEWCYVGRLEAGQVVVDVRDLLAMEKLYREPDFKGRRYCNFESDGIVLKVDDLELQHSLGHSGDDPTNPPNGVIAWKFEEPEAEATIDRIEWNASRTGRVVPTAIFDPPFDLAGTSNSRATCNNLGWMQDRGLGPGARVKAIKGGKIIPKIVEVLEPASDIGAPENCPACNEALRINTSSSGCRDLTCDNPQCSAKQVRTWTFSIAKLGAKGIGEADMERLAAIPKVRRFPDLFDLELDDLLQVGFSEREALLALATLFFVDPVKDSKKLASKIEQARKQKREVEAYLFFASLAIPGAGETAGKALVDRYRAFEPIRTATQEELLTIDGIGPITADAIVEWFGWHNEDCDRLLERFELLLPKSGSLNGTNFVLTGDFVLGKKHWKSKIEAVGGNVQGSVGRKTNYVVKEGGKADGTPTGKEADAAKLGIPVISIPDLEALLT